MKHFKRLLTFTEAAELLGVHRSTVYEWIERYDLPHIRINRVVRFDADALVEWVNAHGRPPGPPERPQVLVRGADAPLRRISA